MICFSREAESSFEQLFYYPYTFGKYLEKAQKDAKFIFDEISSIPLGGPGTSARIRLYFPDLG